MSSLQSSVAPKERVNIAYQAAVGNARQEKELPLKLLVLGDFTLRGLHGPLEERAPVPIGKDNFNEVLASQNVSLDLRVPDRLTSKDDQDLALTLDIASMKDFEPESIARQ